MGAAATEPMFQYAMPPSAGTHGLRKKKSIEAWAKVRRFLDTCTDAVGPVSLEGAPPDRTKALVVPRRDATSWRAPLAASRLDAITQLIAELVREGRAGRLTLSIEFLLRDPDSGELLPYLDGHFPGGYSSLLLFLEEGKSASCYLELNWPYEDGNHVIARMCDTIEDALRIKLSDDKWYRGMRHKNGNIGRRSTLFPRHARSALLPVEPRPDELDARLLAAIAAAPDDDGPRLAYADALTERGDPRGELIVVQCQLAQLPPDDPARTKLARRESALLAKHGKQWLRVPYAAAATMSRGFVESVDVQPMDVTRFVDSADAVLRLAPTLRDVVVAGRPAVLVETCVAELRASPLAARLRSISTRTE